MAGEKRAATMAESRALAHPLRLRIIRLLFDEELTNKELALRLAEQPATVLHHVRTLVATGFIEPTELRPGARGSTEKPYRSTGRSWDVVVDDGGKGEPPDATLAVVDALRAELVEAGPDGVLEHVRLALNLPADRLDALLAELKRLVDDLAAEPKDPQGERVALHLAVHRRR